MPKNKIEAILQEREIQKFVCGSLQDMQCSLQNGFNQAPDLSFLRAALEYIHNWKYAKSRIQLIERRIKKLEKLK